MSSHKTFAMESPDGRTLYPSTAFSKSGGIRALSPVTDDPIFPPQRRASVSPIGDSPPVSSAFDRIPSRRASIGGDPGYNSNLYSLFSAGVSPAPPLSSLIPEEIPEVSISEPGVSSQMDRLSISEESSRGAPAAKSASLGIISSEKRPHKTSPYFDGKWDDPEPEEEFFGRLEMESVVTSATSDPHEEIHNPALDLPEEFDGEGRSKRASSDPPKRRNSLPGGAALATSPSVPGVTEHPNGEHPSRTLFVRNINSNVEDDELHVLFSTYGSIRNMYTACKHRGFVMISYHDIRDAKRAKYQLQNRLLRRRKLDIHYSIPKDHPSEKDQNQGTLVVFNLDPSVTKAELMKIFGVYGEIKEIRETPNKKHHRFIEFYDVRHAEQAMKALNKTEIHAKKIKIEPSRPGGSRGRSSRFGGEGEEEDEAAGAAVGRRKSLGGALGGAAGMSALPSGVSPGSATSSPRGGYVGSPSSASAAGSSPGRLSSGVMGPSLLHGATFSPSHSASSFGSHSSSSFSSGGYSGSPTSYSGSSGFGGIGAFGGSYSVASTSFSPSPSAFPSFSSSGPLAMSSLDTVEETGDDYGVSGSSYASGEEGGPDGDEDEGTSGVSSSHSSAHASASTSPSSSPLAALWRDPPYSAVASAGYDFKGRRGSSPALIGHSSALDTSSRPRSHSFSKNTRAFPPVGTAPGRRNSRLATAAIGTPQSLVSAPHLPASSSSSSGESSSSSSTSVSRPETALPPASSSPRHHDSESSPFSSPRGRKTSWKGTQTELSPKGRARSSSRDNKKFKLKPPRIQDGTDLRTTLMIKNIPNKYSQKMLLTAIDVNHKGKYDFIYLPIDFKNKCNVGYAFINFIRSIDIVSFYLEFNGCKWKKFNSAKVCEIAYARIQGKHSLIDHFRNSSLMVEDKKCRPLIFHSDGPQQGEAEPFPVGPAVAERLKERKRRDK